MSTLSKYTKETACLSTTFQQNTSNKKKRKTFVFDAKTNVKTQWLDFIGRHLHGTGALAKRKRGMALVSGSKPQIFIGV